MLLSLGALDLRDGRRYVLDGSEIPFPDLASILAELPEYAQGDGAGAMRDAVLETIRAIANKVWADIGAEQNGIISPRFANGPLLKQWGFIRKMAQDIGEPSGAYRSRLLSAGDGITPDAIKTAVLAAADDFGAKVVFQEPANDSSFYDDDDPNTEAFCSFYQPDNAIYWNYDPTVPNPTTGGYYIGDPAGGQFWIIMQLGAGADDLAPHFLADDDLGDDPQDFFADVSDDFGFFAFDGDPLETRIVSEVNARTAFGVVWMLIEDPNLNGAI